MGILKPRADIEKFFEEGAIGRKLNGLHEVEHDHKIFFNLVIQEGNSSIKSL
jgi:hypothetical protein